MKVQFVGKVDSVTLMNKLTEIAASTADRAMSENEGTLINGFEIHDAEFTVKYHVEGIADPQVLTVEHHEGYPEMFTWIVNADTDEANSNKDESQFDEYSVKTVKEGKEPEFAEIASNYSKVDIQEIVDLSEDYGTMNKKVFEHKDGFRVVQVWQNSRLVQEYKLIPKEDIES